MEHEHETIQTQSYNNTTQAGWATRTHFSLSYLSSFRGWHHTDFITKFWIITWKKKRIMELLTDVALILQGCSGYAGSLGFPYLIYVFFQFLWRIMLEFNGGYSELDRSDVNWDLPLRWWPHLWPRAGLSPETGWNSEFLRTTNTLCCLCYSTPIYIIKENQFVCHCSIWK